MRRARVAINTAVFATAVRVDRLGKGKVRRLVTGNNAPGPLHGDDGQGTAGLFLQRRIPAVVESLARILLEAPFGVQGGAAALVDRAMVAGYRLHCHTGHLTSIASNKEAPQERARVRGPGFEWSCYSSLVSRPSYLTTVPSSGSPPCITRTRDWRTHRGC